MLILLVPVPSLSTCKMIVSKRKWRKSGAARTLLRPVPLRSSVAHHACRKRLFSLNKFSLCLSRACLGKMIVLYINCSKEVRFSRRNPPRNHLGCSVVAIRGGNARLAPQLPLRVTGACLGKFKQRSAFHRLAEKCNSSRFITSPEARCQPIRSLRHAGLHKTPSVSTFPVLVPSLSWQKSHF